jgi:hypothetical protein
MNLTELNIDDLPQFRKFLLVCMDTGKNIFRLKKNLVK